MRVRTLPTPPARVARFVRNAVRTRFFGGDFGRREARRARREASDLGPAPVGADGSPPALRGAVPRPPPRRGARGGGGEPRGGARGGVAEGSRPLERDEVAHQRPLRGVGTVAVHVVLQVDAVRQMHVAPEVVADATSSAADAAIVIGAISPHGFGHGSRTKPHLTPKSLLLLP